MHPKPHHLALRSKMHILSFVIKSQSNFRFVTLFAASVQVEEARVDRSKEMSLKKFRRAWYLSDNGIAGLHRWAD
jgi:hypothetical protein